MSTLKFEEESITDKANRLAREAVKVVMAKHTPHPTAKGGVECGYDGVQWPCYTVQDMGEAEEAISMAEEEEERASKVHYCGVEVVRARLYGEYPTPAEYCENEVDAEGEPCAEHDEGNPHSSGLDDEDDAYERWKDARLDD